MAELAPEQPYDLFVSYAHVDNDDNWVADFVDKLRAAIAIRNGGTPIKTYFDRSKLQANHVLDSMLAHARNAKLFLAIGSRAYVERPFTKKELEAFHAAHQDGSRIFVIEILPLLPNQQWPESVREHTPQPFFHRGDDDLEMPLTPGADQTRYKREITRLAEHIVRELRAIDAKAAAPIPAPVPVAVPPPAARRADPAPLASGFERKRVLIAQETEDLDDEAEALRAYLRDFEILPETPYPQDGAKFTASYLLDLDRADLVVQLLGPRPGRKPPDLAEGYTLFQWNAARSHQLDIMQWRHPDIDLDQVKDADYRQMLTEPTVMACGLQEFMASVRNKAMAPVAKDRPANGSVIYVHASQNDMDIARRIGENCGKYKLFCHLPQYDQKIINTRAVQERLSTSNAVLFLYCNADIGWARREAEEVYKYSRRGEGQVIALCLGPPSDKPEINIVFPDARIIDSHTEEDFLSQIDLLLKELAA